VKTSFLGRRALTNSRSSLGLECEEYGTFFTVREFNLQSSVDD
jgi:hypothetical protein